MLLKHDPKGKFTAILWDSVAEPQALASNESAWKDKAHAAKAAENFTKQREDSAQEWLGAPNVKELQNRLQNGWADGVKKIEQIATRELSAPASVRRRRFKSDQGDELDMQAVWRGDLSRSWSRTRRANRVGSRSVTIVIDLCASAGVTSDRLFWRGASALRLAQLLTESGYSVALYGGFGGSRSDASGKLTVGQLAEIKSQDSPLDMDKLAALTAMSGFFRTSLFAGIHFACDQYGQDTDWGLGKPSPEHIKAAVKLLPVPQNVIIQKDVLNEKAANDWIDEALKQIDSPELQAA